MRITKDCLVAAINEVQHLNQVRTERRLDEVYSSQPNLLASVLVVTRMGVSQEKMGFLLRLLLVCCEAMERSPFTWETITEEDQERNMSVVVGTAKLSEDHYPDFHDQLAKKVLDEHREKYLLAFVSGELKSWRKEVEPEESDKYLLMSAMNLVECIARGKATRESAV